MTTRHEPGTFCWFECATRDVAAAKRFYTQLFGWNTVDMPMPHDQAGFYTLFKLGKDDVAGMYAMEGPMFDGVPSNWATYVTVADVDDTVRRAESLGATVVAPPMDVENVGASHSLPIPPALTSRCSRRAATPAPCSADRCTARSAGASS